MKQQQQKKELLPFRVIYSSSEQDADHSAIDFGLRSMIPSIYQPGTDRNSCEHQNGWRSSKAFDSTRDAHYPHEIGIQFPTSSSTKCHYHYVDEVHFMMPNEHIPQHVSIHYVPAASASSQPLAYQSHPEFLALGEASFQNTMSSPAMEQKIIHLNGLASSPMVYLKFQFSRPYARRSSSSETQVGILDIKVYGHATSSLKNGSESAPESSMDTPPHPIVPREELTAFTEVENALLSIGIPVEVVTTSEVDYASSSSSPMFTRGARRVALDPKTNRAVEELRCWKEKAVKAEEYDEATRLASDIDTLCRQGKLICNLEREERTSVAVEAFEKAQEAQQMLKKVTRERDHSMRAALTLARAFDDLAASMTSCLRGPQSKSESGKSHRSKRQSGKSYTHDSKPQQTPVQNQESETREVYPESVLDRLCREWIQDEALSCQRTIDDQDQDPLDIPKLTPMEFTSSQAIEFQDLAQQFGSFFIRCLVNTHSEHWKLRRAAMELFEHHVLFFTCQRATDVLEDMYLLVYRVLAIGLADPTGNVYFATLHCFKTMLEIPSAIAPQWAMTTGASLIRPPILQRGLDMLLHALYSSIRSSNVKMQSQSRACFAFLVHQDDPKIRDCILQVLCQERFWTHCPLRVQLGSLVLLNELVLELQQIETQESLVSSREALLDSIQTYYLDLLIPLFSSSDIITSTQRRMHVQIWTCLENIQTFKPEDHHHVKPTSTLANGEQRPYFSCAGGATTTTTSTSHCPLFREYPFSDQEQHQIQAEIQSRELLMKKQQLLEDPTSSSGGVGFEFPELAQLNELNVIQTEVAKHEDVVTETLDEAPKSIQLHRKGLHFVGTIAPNDHTPDHRDSKPPPDIQIIQNDEPKKEDSKRAYHKVLEEEKEERRDMIEESNAEPKLKPKVDTISKTDMPGPDETPQTASLEDHEPKEHHEPQDQVQSEVQSDPPHPTPEKKVDDESNDIVPEAKAEPKAEPKTDQKRSQKKSSMCVIS